MAWAARGPMSCSGPMKTSSVEWLADALCASETFKELAYNAGAHKNPSQVFYGNVANPSTKTGKAAKARFATLWRRTCGVCPVRVECRNEAMSYEVEGSHGNVGGLTSEARDDIVDNAADELSTGCPCGVMLYGSTGHPPPDFCSTRCKNA